MPRPFSALSMNVRTVSSRSNAERWISFFSDGETLICTVFSSGDLAMIPLHIDNMPTVINQYIHTSNFLMSPLSPSLPGFWRARHMKQQKRRGIESPSPRCRRSSTAIGTDAGDVVSCEELESWEAWVISEADCVDPIRSGLVAAHVPPRRGMKALLAPGYPDFDGLLANPQGRQGPTIFVGGSSGRYQPPNDVDHRRKSLPLPPPERPLSRSMTVRRPAVPASSRHSAGREKTRERVLYQAEYAFLTKRLDTVDRLLAWLESKGRRFTRTACNLTQEQADLARRLMQIEYLTAYDKVY